MENQQPPPARSSMSSEAGHPRRKWRLVVRLYVWVVLALAAVAIVVLRFTDVMADHAAANIGTLIAAFVAVVTVILWFAVFSGFSRWVRMLPLLGSLAFCGAFAALFRIEHVSGELVPRFALRFSSRPDEMLDKPLEADYLADKNRPVDVAATTADDFPQFLGPDRSASIDHPKLARDWTTSPPQLVWQRNIGAGWSGFAVVNGYAVTMEQRGYLEMVTCYDARAGQFQWSYSTAVRYQSVLAGIGPRATPTIDQGMVYALGATGHLCCLDGASGRPVWEKDLLEEYQMTQEDEEAELPYGRANSPLVVGELLIVPAGGPQRRGWVSLVAYNKKTGEKAWEGGNRQISYSSPVLAILAGVHQILIVNQDYASGHDLRTGKVLWEYPWPGKSHSNANVSQAVPAPPDCVLLSKGYGGGAALVQLVPKDDGTFGVRELWRNSRVMRTKFTNAALHEGYVYGLSDGILECVNLESGQSIWKGGRYGHGQVLRVGELLLVLSEKGRVALVEATPDRRNHVLGQFQALEGKTWNTFALYGPYLLVRNAAEAACYQLPLQEP